MLTISRFQGEHGFLSNFSPAVVILDGEAYPTVEHAYQAAKTLRPSVRATIQSARTPGEAKRLGRRVIIRPAWEWVKLSVMKDLLHQKFAAGSANAALLCATGDAHLIEGNTWGATFWGQCPLGTGENHLGRLLMEIRDALAP